MVDSNSIQESQLEQHSSSSKSSLSYIIRDATPHDVPSIYQLIKGLADYEKLSHEVTNTIEQLTEDGFGKEPKFFSFVVELTQSASSMNNSTSDNHREDNVTTAESSPISHNSSADDSKIIGFALCFYSYSTWKGVCLYLEDIYIQPSYRGRGIGMNVFRYIMEEAKKRQCYRVVFQALDWNTPAREFYQSLNALETPEWISIRFTADRIDKFIDTFGTYTNPVYPKQNKSN